MDCSRPGWGDAKLLPNVCHSIDYPKIDSSLLLLWIRSIKSGLEKEAGWKT